MTAHDTSPVPDSQAITNPERIRALAHPLRLELLDHLRRAGEATATECADAVGESVASCSFHLRTLEKYGFIERAPRRGREKPWRVVEPGALHLRPATELPGSSRAVVEVARVQLHRETERIQRYLDGAEHEPQEWLDAATLSQSAFWATAEELRQLSEDLRDLVRRFDGRIDPARRPAGARPAHLFGVVNPEPREGL